jgi:hypothetical protein
MGLLHSRWEAEYDRHNITVSRNELTRGVRVEWDGRLLTKQNPSLFAPPSLLGLGRLQSVVSVDGHSVPLVVTLGVSPGCAIELDGRPLPVRTVE